MVLDGDLAELLGIRFGNTAEQSTGPLRVPPSIDGKYHRRNTRRWALLR